MDHVHGAVHLVRVKIDGALSTLLELHFVQGSDSETHENVASLEKKLED